MIRRYDMNKPGDILHQVRIELVTERYSEKIEAVVYPNYCERIRVKMTNPGLGFEIDKDHARNLIEVLEAALRACE